MIIATACLMVASAAFAEGEPTSAEISAADNRQIAVLIEPIFTSLKAGDAESAVQGFLGKSPLLAGRNAELQNLSAQIESAIRIYGPISDCVFSELEERGGVVQRRIYLCQHRDYLTRWKITVGKATSGWTPISMIFDDEVATGL